MALDKAIKSGKEHRKPYRGAKSVDETCRNHGGRRHKRQCPWCLGNRLNKNKQKDKVSKKDIADFYNNI